MSDTATVPAELTDPVSSEVVSTDSVDDLCMALERIREDQSRLSLFRHQCIEALQRLATGDTRTQRVRGKLYAALITAPPRAFDQSRLREIVNSYPQFSNEFIRVSGYAVEMKEFKKLETTTATDPAFDNFAKMLTGAERPATAHPTITIEALNHE